MVAAVIFDADDTLWATEPLYDAALDLAQAEVERAGVDGAEWRRRQRQIDIESARSVGFAVTRFPASSVRAYEELAASVDPEVGERVRAASATVFEAKADLVPDAVAVLAALQATRRLALVTKGDRAIQHKRVSDSGLVDYFDLVAIVARKHASTYRAACELLEVAPHEAVSVGNSLRSDVLPALAAGLRGIWVEAYVWEHERHERGHVPEGVVELTSLAEVPAAIERMA